MKETGVVLDRRRPCMYVLNGPPITV